jgi:hypothetical protein
MKARFRSVPAAESIPVVEARDACMDDKNENKVDLVVGGKLDFVLLFCKRHGRDGNVGLCVFQTGKLTYSALTNYKLT